MDDGKRWYSDGRCVWGDSYMYKGGSLREGELQIRSDSKLADDGKRLDALDVDFAAKAIYT